MARTFLWNFSIADPIHCFLACTSTMRTEHPIRGRILARQVHDQPETQYGRRRALSTTGAGDTTRAPDSGVLGSDPQSFSNGSAIWEFFSGELSALP